MDHSKYLWMHCILLLSICGLVAGQSNLLHDPGFESWRDNSKLKFWEKESGCELKRDTTIKCDGQFSAQLKKSGKSNKGIYQDIPVQAGKKYTFKAQAYSDGNVILGIVITWYSANQKYLGYSGPKKSTRKGEWQELVLNEKSQEWERTL